MENVGELLGEGGKGYVGPLKITGGGGGGGCSHRPPLPIPTPISSTKRAR